MRVKRLRNQRKNTLKRSTWRSVFSVKNLFKVGLIGFVVVTGLLALYTIFVLPDVKQSQEFIFPESTIIYDRGALNPANDPNNHILYTIHGDENREYVPLNEMSPWIVEATLAIEDDQFYNHYGVDVGGTGKGFLNHFLGVGSARGGSTITQQLVKNTFLTNERSIQRKFNEILLSIKLELVYSKDEILELYLNKIPYGNNAYGIEAASKTYFGKSARELNIVESAILASIPNAPTKYSPYGSNRDLLMGYEEFDDGFDTEEEAAAAVEISTENEETSDGNDERRLKVYRTGRKDLVLQRMLELGHISQTQFNQAWIEGRNIKFQRSVDDIRAPHFVFYVRQKLEDKYGKDFLAQGGLKIYTTLDPDLQESAEAAVLALSADYQEKYNASNVALAAIYNHETMPDGTNWNGRGQILAYIGGKNFFDTENDGQVDVLTSRRQPGSSFKPMAYAAGFAKGLAPGSVTFDVETNFGTKERPYEPQNFDETFRGPVSFREALNASLNIAAVKMAYLASPNSVLELATKLGVKYEGSADVHGVAVGIGVAEVEPLSHINAYQAFAGDGVVYEPTAILRIENAEGVVLESADIESQKLTGIDPEVAGMVRDILTDESTRPTTDGFNWNRLLQLDDIDNGAKTGTSNRVVQNPDYDSGDPDSERFNTVPGDSWTVGFTPHLVTGVWVGNNRGEPMESGATGMTLAAPIWKAFNETAYAKLLEKGIDAELAYRTPKELQTVEINRLSGEVATSSTPAHLRRSEVFASFALPTIQDKSIVRRELNLLTGALADESTPDYAKSTEPVLMLTSIRPDISNWQRPVTNWLSARPLFSTTLGKERSPSFEWEVPESVLAAQEKAQNPYANEMVDPAQQKAILERLEELYGGASNAPQTRPDSQLAVRDEITILSPRAPFAFAPGSVNFQLRLPTAPIRSVEYFIDGKLVHEARRNLSRASFVLPVNLKSDRFYQMQIMATDDALNVWTETISFKVLKDERGPLISFSSPSGNDRFLIGDSVVVSAEVVDPGSGVDRVEFYLDGTLIETKNRAPFSLELPASGNTGRRIFMIVAYDQEGNRSERRMSVSYEQF